MTLECRKSYAPNSAAAHSVIEVLRMHYGAAIGNRGVIQDLKFTSVPVHFDFAKTDDDARRLTLTREYYLWRHRSSQLPAKP